MRRGDGHEGREQRTSGTWEDEREPLSISYHLHASSFDDIGDIYPSLWKEHTPGPGVREAEERLVGARVAAVWLLSHVDTINQQLSSNVDELCGALP